MNTVQLKSKIGAGIAMAGLLTMSAVPSAFASTVVGSAGNGAFSNNNVDVSNNCSSSTDQSSQNDFMNTIDLGGMVGAMESLFNTGGSDTSIGGNSSSNVGVTNLAGANTAVGMNGCAEGLDGVTTSGNGAFFHKQYEFAE